MPVRADRTALGTLPSAAYKHCEAATTASGTGWYVFSPLDFTVVWDGSEVLWTYEGTDAWYPLRTAQFPGFAELFDAHAPAHLRGYSPPFLTSTAQPGILQIWSGLLVRTALEWSTLVRPLVNYPASNNYMLFEGIVETDRWFGPLFINLRLTRPDHPIHFGTDLPLFQVQSVPRAAYSRATQSACTFVDEPFALTPADWVSLEQSVLRGPHAEPKEVGTYAAAVRTRSRNDHPE